MFHVIIMMCAQQTKLSGSNSQAMEICERSVRNCPASADIWVLYLRFAEKNKSEHSVLKGRFGSVLFVLYSTVIRICIVLYFVLYLCTVQCIVIIS